MLAGLIIDCIDSHTHTHTYTCTERKAILNFACIHTVWGDDEGIYFVSGACYNHQNSVKNQTIDLHFTFSPNQSE